MQTNNVLYDRLPDTWNDYKINTWFQIGIQVFSVVQDEDMTEKEKTDTIIQLLFTDPNTGRLREYPKDTKSIEECMKYLLNGWDHDNKTGSKDKKRYFDFYVDQWRIYADFIATYNINLNKASMHWWEFMGLLWNLPADTSSFMQVIEIRRKKTEAKMSKKEKDAIASAQKRYELKQPEQRYTKEEENKIDEYDAMMEKIRGKKKTMKQAEKIFKS